MKTELKKFSYQADNLEEAQTLPAYILDAVKLTSVSSIDEVLRYALVDKKAT
jgi:ATP-dependent Lon protease